MTEERPIFDLREHFPRLAASPAGRQLIGLMEGLLGFRRVRRLLRQLEDRCAEGEPPFDAFLSLMGFVPDAPGVVEAIPREGAVVLVCNHPFGGADALVASTLAMRAREDTRVMANAELSAINALKPSLIITEIMGRDGDERRNISALRESLSHLRNGGALVVFPAGAVARWRRGYAAACKAVYTGSNPVRASRIFRSSSVVEQAAVNRWVGGSNPSSGATPKKSD